MTIVVAAICVVMGCDDHEVTTQSPGKESGAATSPFAAGAQKAPGVMAPGAGLQWELPEGWREDKTPRPMREATIQMGEGERSAELVVTRLAGGFGDLASNVNRWRGQIGLPPADKADEVPQETIRTSIGEARAIRLEGEKQASIIVVVPDGETNLFFRLTGERETVLANEAKLKGLLATLQAKQQ